MGKYILVEFDTDDSAERLCAQINTATDKGRPFRIAGIFQKPPTKRCECQGVGTTSMKKGARKRSDTVIKRHKKTGFYYCTVCKRVRKGWQSPRNQLDPETLSPIFFSKGQQKEATLHMTQDNELLPNFPLTTRTTPLGEPVAEYEKRMRVKK